jgi:hypothetical protein
MTTPTTLDTQPAVMDTLVYYLGPARSAMWLVRAQCGVTTDMLVIRTPFQSAKYILENALRSQVRQAAEHLLGDKAGVRIELLEVLHTTANRPTTRKALFV